MNTDQITIAHGTLGVDTDTYFVISPQQMLFIDAAFNIDIDLIGQLVSVIGKMGVPSSAPGITKLLADRIIGHEAIALRAFDIFQLGAGGSQDDNWFRAERELLGLLKVAFPRSPNNEPAHD